jgi:hypothetical protein
MYMQLIIAGLLLSVTLYGMDGQSSALVVTSRDVPRALYTIKHPERTIVVAESIKEKFNFFSANDRHLGDKTVTLSEFNLHHILGCFHAAQGIEFEGLALSDVQPIAAVAGFLQATAEANGNIAKTLILSTLHVPKSAYWISKHFSENSLEFMCAAITQHGEEETQQKLFDFLYEKMFDVPLFKEHRVRDYTQDLQTWSSTNKAYRFYAALSQMRGEKSCKNVLTDCKDMLQGHSNALKGGMHPCNHSGRLPDRILKDVDSWHDMHVLLSDPYAMHSIFFDDCTRLHTQGYMHLMTSSVQRTYLPLIAKSIETLISKAIMPSSFKYMSLYPEEEIRALYNADVLALHSPVFDDKVIYEDPIGGLFTDGFFPRQRKFEITISLSNDTQLPIEALRRLPVQLVLNIGKVPGHLAYMDTYFSEERCSSRIGIEYYLYPPGWRIKTIARLIGYYALCHFLFHTINQYGREYERVTNQRHESDLRGVLGTITSLDQKNALSYLKDSTLQSSGRNAIKTAVDACTQGVTIVPSTMISAGALTEAHGLMDTVNTIGRAWDSDNSFIGYSTWLSKVAIIGFGFVATGTTLIRDALSLLWPSTFARPQCTVKCRVEEA